MSWVLLLVVLTLVFAVVDGMCGSGPLSRLRLPRALSRLISKVAARCRRRRAVHNPFDALQVQSRLGAVADEILRLELDHKGVYAKAHRMRATQKAYDDLLAEACRMAGVEPADRETRGNPQERLREEMELAARGWSW
jgi:hypothetical protein